jgi:hypothetical protein
MPIHTLSTENELQCDTCWCCEVMTFPAELERLGKWRVWTPPHKSGEVVSEQMLCPQCAHEISKALAPRQTTPPVLDRHT